jgi:hypothetical protein
LPKGLLHCGGDAGEQLREANTLADFYKILNGPLGGIDLLGGV